MTTPKERMEKLPKARRDRDEARAGELVAGEMTLQALRKARKQTQARLARKLGINQENVSRLEQRADLLISTLRGYIEAMGGKLHLVAEFPDRPAVELRGLAANDEKDEAAER
jgi:transcriptional regulator with XRE-family HTH domain